MQPAGGTYAAILYALLLVAVAFSASGPPTVGDAGEYLAYVSRFLHLEGPAIPPAEIPVLRQDLAAIDPGLGSWDIEAATFADRSGARHFVHFWLYPLIATPFVALTTKAGLGVTAGFVLVHAALLLLAFHAVSRAAGSIIALLLMAGPVVWWLDKPHPEVFLVALLSIAFASWRDRPIVSLICVGLAGAQVAPLAIFVPLIAMAIALSRRDRETRVGRTRSLLIGAAAVAAITVAPSLYYFWRFGELSLFGRLSTPHWPWPHFGTELFDLTLGLVPNWPMFAAAVLTAAAIAIVRAPRDRRRIDIAMALVGVLVLLFVFPQIGNVTHGGTPGMSRYGLWLVPLAIPVFAVVRGSRPWLWLSLAAAAASVPYSLVHFHPSRPEFSHRPTAVSLWVWQHHPDWSTPLPRVFVNALRAPDETAPVATPHCTKALLIGRGEAQGMWPRACAPARVPAECRTPGALCYANRHALVYRFTPVTSAQANFLYDPQRVWAKAAEEGIFSVMASIGWADLTPLDPENRASLLSGVERARVEMLAGNRDRLFAVLRPVSAGARVRVRHAAPANVVLTDGETGRVIREMALDASSESVLTLDEPRQLVVLTVRSR